MAHISFILPFYNEVQTLPHLIDGIRAIMSNEPEDCEMILVNDDSTDSSVDLIAQRAREKKKGDIVLVNMSRRFGVEESFMAGIAVARGDAVIMMYTDLQDPLEVVPQMLKHWREGVDVVHAVRRRRIGEHPLKKMAVFVAYRIIAKMADIKIPFDAGEFKLISKNVAKHLLNLPEVKPYLRGLIPWIGFKQVYLEYDMRPRIAGRSKMPLLGSKAWALFLNGVISFSDTPMYIIFLVGFLGLLVSVGLGLVLLITGGQGGLSATAVSILFLWASLMFALGLLALYVLKIYKNTLGRPRYIVKDVIKF